MQPFLASSVYFFVAAVVLGLAFSLYLLLLFFSSSPRRARASELSYRSIASETSSTTSPPDGVLLPSTVRDAATLDLSVVIPAYNETQRLPIMLDETLKYLRARAAKKKGTNFTWEILVMDDASRDGTSERALEWARSNKVEELRVVRMEVNRGKGGTVKQGMLRARGMLLLMVDADGATRFSDLDVLEARLSVAKTASGLGVAIGSRAHLTTTEAVVKRSFIRNFLMYSFHSILIILGMRGIGDTQCGFKLFTRSAARQIFPNQHVEGWIFDIEVLLLAQKFRIPIVEVPVTWREIDGSKMNIMLDSLRMLKDLVIIRGNYLFGIWKARSSTEDPDAALLDQLTKAT